MYEEAYKHCKSKGVEKARQAAAADKSNMEREDMEACLRLLNAGEFPRKQRRSDSRKFKDEMSNPDQRSQQEREDEEESVETRAARYRGNMW